MRVLSNLSSREHRILLLTVSVGAAALAYTLIIEPAIGSWQQLNQGIERKEVQLLKLKRRVKRGQLVDKEFEIYKTRMSAEKTDEEVIGSLQRELESIGQETGVTIPTMRRGSIEEFNYYKMYKVEAEIEGTTIGIAEFLHRLRTSPHLLQVEEMEIRKGRSGNTVRGRLLVSRVLVPLEEEL